MGSLSKLSEKCKACPYVDSCNHKQMEAVAISELPSISANISQNISQSLAMPMARETMLVNDGSGNMVRVYKDEIEKQLYQELYKHLNFNYGA